MCKSVFVLLLAILGTSCSAQPYPNIQSVTQDGHSNQQSVSQAEVSRSQYDGQFAYPNLQPSRQSGIFNTQSYGQVGYPNQQVAGQVGYPELPYEPVGYPQLHYGPVGYPQQSNGLVGYPQQPYGTVGNPYQLSNAQNVYQNQQSGPLMYPNSLQRPVVVIYPPTTSGIASNEDPYKGRPILGFLDKLHKMKMNFLGKFAP